MTVEAVAMVDQTDFEEIERQFDALVVQMQTPAHAAAVERLMNAPSGEIRAMLEAYYRGPEQAGGST